MKCEVVGEVLRVTAVSGRPVDLDFSRIDVGPTLRHSLMDRFIELAGAAGSWGSPSTLRNALAAARVLFAGAGVVDAADITALLYRERLFALTPSMRHHRHVYLRRLLPGLKGISADCVRGIENLPAANPAPQSREPLTDAQIEQLRAECFNTVRDGLHRVTASWELVQKFRLGRYQEDDDDFEYAQVLDEIARTGDIAARVATNPPRRKVPISVQRRLYPAGGNRYQSVFPLWTQLYPSTADLAASVLGLVITCGWNLSVARSLNVDDITRVDARDGSEPAHLRVRLHKPRRGEESDWFETYSDTSARSKARLLQMIISLTHGARVTLTDAGYPTTALLVSHAGALNSTTQTTLPIPFTVLPEAGLRTVMKYLADWRKSHPEMAFATPSALRSFFTTQVHPQGHTLNTNTDYNLKDPTVKVAVRPAIATGIQAAYNDVQARVVAAAEATTAQLPDGTSQGVLDEINSGARDTVAVACVDHDHHPETGDTCRVSFLSCFACSNAVVLKRHLPRIVALHDHLESLRSVLDPRIWNARFGSHHARVSSLLDPGRFPFATSDIDYARASITADDRERVARLMNRSWDV